MRQMAGRNWDAKSYDQIGSPMTSMAEAVLDRLPLEGHETVLDAGCGTGRVSELLAARLPEGRVISVDADPDMVKVAAENLGPAADVRLVDLLDLDLGEPVDAIFSTATFHWIPDHQRLFEQLFAALRPGGRLVAQCGGEGNIAAIRSACDELAHDPRYAPSFAGWEAPWYYSSPDQAAARLRAAGFVELEAALQPWPVVPDDPHHYLTTIVLGAQVQHLPEALRSTYIDDVIARLPEPVTIDYVRLNLTAVRPA